MNVGQAINEYDGKHVADLRRAARAFAADEAAALTKACLNGTPDQQEAASWIIKALVEKGGAEALPMRQVFSALSGSLGWGTALHLLQCVQHLPRMANVSQIAPWLNHHKLLVRIWALDALWHVDRPAALPLAQDALTDTSAAMRARARALLNIG